MKISMSNGMTSNSGGIKLTDADITRHAENDQRTSVPPLATPTPITLAVPSSPIGVWKIAFGVLLGNLMFGIIGGIVYAMATAR